LNILRSIPNIKVINSKHDCQINTVQGFDEDEDRVILQCAEYIQCFKRGFICDMDCRFEVYDTKECKAIGESQYEIKDLLLVYIHKYADKDSYSQFKYVFYK